MTTDQKAPPSSVLPQSGGSRGPWRRLAWVAAGLVVVLLAVYVVDLAVAGDRIPRGVRVAGVDVGGKSRAEASRLLTSRLAAVSGTPLLAVAGGTSLSVDPGEAGLSVDLDATLDRAGSQPLNPLTRIRDAVGTRDVALVLRTDETRLAAAVRTLAARVDRAPREGSITLRGTEPVAVLPVEGRTLARDKAATALREGFAAGRSPIELPVETTPVKTTATDVQQVLDRVVKPAVSAPVTVDLGRAKVVVPPAALAAGLVLEPSTDGRLVPRLDPPRLERALGKALTRVEVPARDASFAVGASGVRVVPAVSGRIVDTKALAPALLAAAQKPAPRVLPFRYALQPAKLTTEQAKALGIREQISTFTTHHKCCQSRVTNIHRIADIVDGTVVRPGETYSLNDSVGERDAARGFVKAPMILEGEFRSAVGGGVSQFATTLFNAVFFGGLEDVQHTPHSYYISRYPPGRESTVSYPEPDFRFRNDSPYGVLIKTGYTSRSITVSFYSTKRYEIDSVSGPRRNLKPFTTKYVTRDDCTASLGEEGFTITVTRVFTKNGVVVRRQPFVTRYQPEPRFICGPPPAPPKPPAATTPRPTAPPSPAPSASPSPTPAPR